MADSRNDGGRLRESQRHDLVDDIHDDGYRDAVRTWIDKALQDGKLEIKTDVRSSLQRIRSDLT